MIAGVIGAIVGLVMLFGAASITLPDLGRAGSVVMSALRGVVLIFSVIEFGGVAAYQGRSWYGSMIGSILGLATASSLPAVRNQNSPQPSANKGQPKHRRSQRPRVTRPFGDF